MDATAQRTPRGSPVVRPTRPSDVYAAMERVAKHMEAEGPFEGVIGFSQGGEVAMLLLGAMELESVPSSNGISAVQTSSPERLLL